MRLPPPTSEFQKQLDEFDIWITPSLGEIADTGKFKEELNLVVSAFEIIGAATNNFASVEQCKPDAMARTLADILTTRDAAEREQILQALASTLFAVTGKSDNNFKCQFPLFLRDHSEWKELPKVTRRRGAVKISTTTIPRVLTSERYMSIIAQIDKPELEAKLLNKFIAFMLKDDNAINQFWSLGYAYFALKEFNKSEHLLAPIVIFKVRGSVTASGGHEPEDILRGQMLDWGMREGIDFNTLDVVVLEAEQTPDRKTRAYDFILPYRTEGWYSNWNHRIFVQCQFYAGDSGSVSHKNVDQTKSSRDYIEGFVNEPSFLEYVDGAGYFSSLNGDLKKLLAYENTSGFFQIRSAAIRLRQQLQEIKFLTPLEVEHCIAVGNDTEDSLTAYLMANGYKTSEVERCLQVCQGLGILDTSNSVMSLSLRFNPRTTLCPL